MEDLILFDLPPQVDADTLRRLVSGVVQTDPPPAGTGLLLVGRQADSLAASLGGQCRGIPALWRFEQDAASWLPLRDGSYRTVCVLAAGPPEQHLDPVCIASYLPAQRRIHHNAANGQQTDLAVHRPALVPDYRPGPILRGKRSTAVRDWYFGNFTKDLVKTLIDSNFQFGRGLSDGMATVRNYSFHRFALDLGERSLTFLPDAGGLSKAHYVDRALDLHYSPDQYRMVANLIRAIAGIRSVLEVGAGSGFLEGYLAKAGGYDRLLGLDGARERVEAARLNARLNGFSAEFDTGLFQQLPVPDRSFDLTASSYALEQCGTALPQAIDEMLRVTRRYLVLYEPSVDHFNSPVGLYNVMRYGWSRGYQEELVRRGLPFVTLRPPLQYYGNPATFFVVSVEKDPAAHDRLMEIARATADDWPGGIAEHDFGIRDP